MNLYEAHKQWQTRPADERLWNLDELLTETQELKEVASVEETLGRDISAYETDGDIGFDINGTKTLPTHHAFSQVCVQTKAPAGYLRKIPATLAADCLNHGFQQFNGDTRQVLVRWEDANRRVCAFTSDRYDRIWDTDVVDRLIPLQNQGWRIPPARPAVTDPRARPATAEDILDDTGFGLSVQIGDMIAPAGIYLSDHDMFVFMVNEERTINVPGAPPLSRGFFAQNSEVGTAAFKLTMFLYNHVCGNHIIWDASEVKQLRIVHKGLPGRAEAKAFEGMTAQLTEYSDRGASEDEAIITRAMEMKIGNNKDEVLDALFGRKVAGKKVIDAAYELAATHPEDGHKGANTAWGMVQGLTRMANLNDYADHSFQINRAAGKVLALAA